MKITAERYVFEVDEHGITAICRETGERSNITHCNGIADTLGFERDDDGERARDLDPDAIAAQLNERATVAEIEKRLSEDRDVGSWRDN